MSLLLKGILIGLLFGVPVGAVGAMTVQRTWEHGIKAGLLTGMGSSVADCIYAGIGAFGLTMVSDFLLEYQTVIHLVGGAIVLYLGIRLFFRKGEEAEVPEVSGRCRMFLTSFAVGITNPAAILTFLFAFDKIEKEEQINHEKTLRFAVHCDSCIFDSSMWKYTGTDAC